MNTRTGAVLVAIFAVMLLAAQPAQAMTNGVPVTDPTVASWVAVLAPTGDAPMMDVAGCTGALVTPDRVLTSARCVEGIDPSQEQVHINANTLSADIGEVRGIRGVAVMPGYRLLPSPVSPDDKDYDSTEYDLAVILLDKPVTDIQPLQIAWHDAPAGTPIAMFAHGLTGRTDVGAANAGQVSDVSQTGDESHPAQTSATERDDVLHRGDLTVISAPSCAASTPATIDADSNICAQDVRGGVTGCWLDGGSPAVATVAGVPELVGTYSFGGETAGKDCTPPAPAVFADAPQFRTWILGPLQQREPYPATLPQVTRSGNTLHCALPTWDGGRGQDPSTVETSWVALIHDGPDVRELPVDGNNTTELTLAPDLNLQGNQIACAVHAANSGGDIKVISVGLTV